MLIIGNAAVNKIYSSEDLDTCFDEKIIEIVYKGDEQLKMIKKKFNITKEFKVVSNMTSISANKNHVFLVHNAKDCMGLSDILDYSLANNNEFKYSNPIIQYIFDRMRIRFIHEDINVWEDRMMSLAALFEDFIMYLETSLVNKLDSFSIRLTGWITNQPGVSAKPYEYSGYDIIPKENILNIVTLQNGNSLWSKVLSSTSKHAFPMQYNWKKLTFREKVESILEKLYLDSINEYIIPEMAINNKIPSYKPETLLNLSIMNLISHNGEQWLNSFIIYNYTKIMYSANYNFINRFIEAVNKGEVETEWGDKAFLKIV